MHLLHPLFSVPVGLYFPDWRLFACCRDMPYESIPPVVELGIDAFGVSRAVHDLPRLDNAIQIEGTPPPPTQLPGYPLQEGREYIG